MFNSIGWIMPVTLILIVLLLMIIMTIIKFKKTRGPIISIKKVAVISLFSAILFISGIITLQPAPGISASPEEAILLFSGFLLGPLEGLLVACIGDGIGTILMGGLAGRHLSYWLAAPIAALLGSLLKVIYDFVKTRKQLEKKLGISLNIILSLLVLISIIIVIVNPIGIYKGGNNPQGFDIFTRVLIPIFGISFFIGMQFMYFYIKKNNNMNINLFILIITFVLIEKIINSWFLGTINSNQILLVQKH